MRLLFVDLLRIPSGAMAPALVEGDYVFLNRLSYGLSAKTAPERGDVVAFHPAFEPRTIYVFRVIGLPGDTVQMLDGRLSLNGATVPLEPAGSFDWRALDYYRRITSMKLERLIETLPNGRGYAILRQSAPGALAHTRPYVVPPGHIFVLGDNRDNSADSRSSILGFVPIANVLGKFTYIWVSPEPNEEGRFSFFRVDRWRGERLLKRIE